MSLSQINLITTLFFFITVLVFPAKAQEDHTRDRVLFQSLLKNKTIFSYSTPNFTQSDYNNLYISGDAGINNKAIQLTPDSVNADIFTLFHKSGRASFKRSFKLYELHNDRVISFNSTFLMNAYPTPIKPNSTVKAAGDGLSFIIASDTETPSGSTGRFLGLTNRTNDGNSSNKFIAIEFDTVINVENGDPNNNHLGLNINSVRSFKTVNLTEYNITIAPEVGTKYRVWIQYSTSMVLDVYMVLDGKPKPKTPILSEKLNFKELNLNQYSYFGFSGSTGDTAQLNCILNWDLNVDILPEEKKAKDLKLLKILLGAGIPGVVILMICVVGLGYYLHKWSVKDDMSILGALKSLPGMPREFTFKELKKATNNFDEKMKLGQGGFGVVYKGVLPNDFEYTEIAVKKFLRESLKSKFDFLSELTIINRLRHKHLVRLVGWCHKNGMLLLVYDYMPNGSLDDHLFDEESGKALEWNHRYKITYGVASALHYLHNEYEQTVVHRDLKASNIMLDAEFNARLGDFGLARTIENERTSYAELEGIAGTPGYIAPECFHTGKATRESDVFGFGAIVLEVVCGERPWTKVEGFQCLVDWVWKLYREGRILEAVDQRLGDDYVVEEAQRLLLLGLACSHPIASERPKTQIIFQIISGSVPVPSVPPFKPSFVWPSMEPGESGMTNNTQDETPMASSYYGSSISGSGWTPKSESRESFVRFKSLKDMPDV